MDKRPRYIISLQSTSK